MPTIIFKTRKQTLNTFEVPTPRSLFPLNIEKWFKKVSKSLLDLLSEFEEMGTGWSTEDLINLKINIIKTRPLDGASFVVLPDFIKRENAVTNIVSDGKDCFATAVMVGLYPARAGSSRRNQKSSYVQWKQELKLDEKNFPISYEQIPEFEKTNNI
ncbi:hypothetical protein QAD02_007411 [Eretmocerus hayati]|uniref:Uncharacterized protein n=1 Tax=Eretmocerus hayati TaxID=131215 RepID=A0ACC2N5Z9_9HYME|nr:hypothetical protein QAD02_007411 [Eretmocerus hayati]